MHPVFRLPDVIVWSVRGEVVRDDLDVDFVAGGHHWRYGFIPESEVWIEQTMSTRDFILTAAHEVIERFMMRRGLDYDKAHEAANAMERRLREL